MSISQFLANFNIANADVSVWLFRKSTKAGSTVFTGHWIDTDDALDTALRTAIAYARDNVLETEDYSLTATIEHGQALTIETATTVADQIVEKSSEEDPSRKATKIPHIQNTNFYVVKLTDGDKILHAVRRTDNSWRTKLNKGIIKVIFSDDQLGINPNPDFHLSQYIDFFIADDEIVILDKGSFEKILSYKEAHLDAFKELQTDNAFANLFNDMAPLVSYIGSNKLHLRRVCAIKEKGYYSNAKFLDNLSKKYAQAGLNLIFDAGGILVVTPETCPDIIRALLNHRLYSLFTEENYDVQNSTPV